MFYLRIYEREKNHLKWFTGVKLIANNAMQSIERYAFLHLELITLAILIQIRKLNFNHATE